MEVFQFEKLLQYIEGLLETQEKRMCASFPEGNAAKWVNTCQMSRQKGSQRERSLKWRCRAKSMGFSLLFFEKIIYSLLKSRSQIQNGLIQRENKMGTERNFSEMSQPKYRGLFSRHRTMSCQKYDEDF